MLKGGGVPVVSPHSRKSDRKAFGQKKSGSNAENFNWGGWGGSTLTLLGNKGERGMGKKVSKGKKAQNRGGKNDDSTSRQWLQASGTGTKGRNIKIQRGDVHVKTAQVVGVVSLKGDSNKRKGQSTYGRTWEATRRGKFVHGGVGTSKGSTKEGHTSLSTTEIWEKDSKGIRKPFERKDTDDGRKTFRKKGWTVRN